MPSASPATHLVDSNGRVEPHLRLVWSCLSSTSAAGQSPEKIGGDKKPADVICDELGKEKKTQAMLDSQKTLEMTGSS